MQYLVWFKRQLDPFLDAYFTEKIREAALVDPESVVLVEEVRRFVQNGGKKIRPAFAYAGYIACGGRSHDAILYASSAIEVMHAFALIHDDIIDKADLRRGNPSVHRVFEDFHKRRNFTGSPEDFGLVAALLAGDLAFSFADELLNTAPFPAERIRRAKNYFDLNKKQVIFGEYLDVLASVKKQISEADVLKILEYKTAKYTMERPLHIGACLAGAEEEALTIFSNYAIPLGQAFQIQDDILGTFGQEEQTGKPTDSDIKEGKKTLLVIKAYEFSGPAERKILDEVLGKRKANEKEIENVRAIIRSSGALEYSQNLANRLIKQAKEAIYEEKLEGEGKAYLLQAADYLLTRQL
ncbi:MAG: hypothetical protein A2126_00780 [Candidatus Woykebacteria bacterium GWB1_45_5]|uniref:Polyprenyl synthetase n=2 Tax=Candidatus Woykeibacteriota TaxID=1817899 RepID=A0A1G1W244_9BACT|nr:MAG: hypothetical protein A2113_04145 [Candidatus Woykebacteria bacterium GWA1_44_8]OGY24822.1 MAG: hypothetical protein A2126_00780 [Candidatus Woykebacteria bacterium GWB1_45_5]